MSAIKGVRRAIVAKTTEQLCGRLIFWDVGTVHENCVMLAQSYRHTRYDLSPEVELKPYAPCRKDYEAASRSSAAIGKALKRFDLAFDIGEKKSWLN